jgi:hypothetical protein
VALATLDTTTDRALRQAATFFTVAVLLHNADHLRRGTDSIGHDVFAAGSASVLLEVGIVVLICQRHRLAPIAAAATGFSLAAGYLFVHFLPQRSWLSDSFTSAAHVSLLSWGAASLEVVAATTLGVVGLLALNTSRGQPRPLRDVLTEPVVLVMVLGNAVIMALSIAQLV